MKRLTSVQIPDVHIPWHNIEAVNIMFLIMDDIDAKEGIDEINIMGDWGDGYHINLHDKNPHHFCVPGTFKDEMYICYHLLKHLRDRYPKARIKFIEGNHEQRLTRYFTKKAPELFDVVTIPELFKLEEMGIEYYPYDDEQLVQCLDTDYYLRHSPYTYSKHCAAGVVDKKHSSLGFGCTHRKQTYSCTDAHGRELIGRSLGWLGDRFAPVFKYIKHWPDWGMGFEVSRSVNGIIHPQYIDINHDYKNTILTAVYNGDVYYGEYVKFYNVDDRSPDRILRAHGL